MGNYKKDYLTSQEQLEIMMLLCLKENLNSVINDWSKRDNLSSEDSRNLKMARTYMKKYLTDLFARLDNKELNKLNRKMQINTIRLYDKFQIDQLNKKINDIYDKVVLDSDQYCKFCEEIMDVNCNSCDKHWQECELYKLFDDTQAPESGFCNGNCKYSYNIRLTK